MHYIGLTLWGIGISLALIGLVEVVGLVRGCCGLLALRRACYGAHGREFQDILRMSNAEAKARGLKMVHFPDSKL